jgi:hypothetical protein
MPDQNLIEAISKNNAAIQPVFNWTNTHPGINATASQFPSSDDLFKRLGLSFNDTVDLLNSAVQVGADNNNTDVVTSFEMLLEIALISNLMDVSAYCVHHDLTGGVLIYLLSVDSWRNT